MDDTSVVKSIDNLMIEVTSFRGKEFIYVRRIDDKDKEALAHFEKGDINGAMEVLSPLAKLFGVEFEVKKDA